jgi:site-specific DNA-methyltransferase (adenine-specific)
MQTEPELQMEDGWLNRVHFGDCMETLRRMPDGIVNTCVTSPPYFGLRDYGHAGQIGLEETPEQFIAKLVEVFREVRRVLRDDGTCWVNMGDSYAAGKPRLQEDCEAGGQRWANRQSESRASGLKPKDLIGIPWMLAFALRAGGWYLRQDIIWNKPNPMPESVRDRCTKAHEYIFLLSKSPTYYCDMGAVKEPANLTGKGNANGFRGGAYVNNATFDNSEGGKRAATGNVGARSKRDSFKRDDSKRAEVIPGQAVGTHRCDREESAYDLDERNKRSVWTVATRPYSGAHFATFPPELIEPCILAGAPAGGVVLDPFFGSGTTGEVAQNLGRHWIGCELNPAYKPLQDERLRQPGLILFQEELASIGEQQ